MDEQDLRAAKINYDNIEINDVIEFRAWCLVYAEELIAAVEESQAEAHLEGMTNQFDDAARIFNERLQVIKDSEVLLHGEEEWTNEEDVVTEAVIKELITAVEESQAEVKRLQKENELYAKHIDILSPEKTDER